MAIKDLLIPNYLNELDQQKADIRKTDAETGQARSAERVNNVQADRILQLLPGEVEGQALDNRNKKLDYTSQELLNENQSILNNINKLKIAEQESTNKKAQVEAQYAEQKTLLEIEDTRIATQAKKAQIAQAAAATKASLAQLKREDQEFYLKTIYPKAASTMALVKKRMDAGDLAGANSVYQSALKTFPPEFLQFEGKSGMDLIGPSIEEKDAQIVGDFAEYLTMMSPADSMQGKTTLQSQQNAAALDREKVKNQGDSSDALVDQNRRLDAEVKANSLVEEPLLQGLLGGRKSKKALVDEDGKTIKPLIAAPYNSLKQFAAQKKLKGEDFTGTISEAFTIGTAKGTGEYMDGSLDDVIVPRSPALKKIFDKAITKALEGQSVVSSEDMEKAYQIAINATVTSFFDAWE